MWWPALGGLFVGVGGFFEPRALGVGYDVTRSILTEKIARRGSHVFREYGVDPLERHHVDEVMTRAVISIDGAMTVGDALLGYFGETQAHRAYPVVVQGEVRGLVDRELLIRADVSKTVELVLPSGRCEFARSTETCRSVAARMAALGVERLPVIESSESARLVGIVSRSDLLGVTRHVYEEEWMRERSFARDSAGE